MKRIVEWFLVPCVLVLALSAGAAEVENVPGALSIPGAIAVPQLGNPIIAPAAPILPEALPPSPIAAAVPEAAVPAAAPAAQAPVSAEQALQHVAIPAQPQGVSRQEGQYRAGLQAFDGSVPGNPGVSASLPYDNPDTQSSWYDQHTGQYETQATKIKRALDLALSHPLGAALKNGLKYNTLYRVDNDAFSDGYTVRTSGDDPETFPAGQAPAVIFHHAALRQLSPEYLAAKLASMWARHLYRDTMPVSAEKTYVEGSVLTRVFMGLTGSNSGWWNGAKDRVVSVPGHYDQSGTWVTQNFEIFLHEYFWRQGSNYQNVRQGPYFHDKIMGAQGQPDIEADARGRRTLFQRAQSGEITQDSAAVAQQKFDGFVSNERR